MRKHFERLMKTTIGSGLLMMLQVGLFLLAPAYSVSEAAIGVAQEQVQQEDHGLEMRPQGTMIIKLMRSLDLSKDQTAQLDAVVARYRKENAPLREELRLLLEVKSQGEAADEAKEATLRARQHEAINKMRADVLSLLTADQRILIERKEREFNSKREERWQPRKKMPDQPGNPN
jgi:hypothetical protein